MPLIALILIFCLTATADAEVLVRWDRDDVPSRESLGIESLVVPAQNPRAVRSALMRGYRVYVEVAATDLATMALPPGELAGVVMRGSPSAAQVRHLKERLKSRAVRVLTLDERGKWPHIRTNWVTKNNEVLQVSGRTAQPWIENNAALARVVEIERARRKDPENAPFLSYSWKPITISEEDEGPALANYLVAIAEAGSFGSNLLLPLHERFQRNLLLGTPQARTDWESIRRHLAFYAWDLPRRYEAMANVGVVTGEPMLWYEMLNLLARHNVPFEIVAPAELSGRRLDRLKLLIVLDEPSAAGANTIAKFEGAGGIVKRAQTVADPNAFALDVRRMLGPEHRVLDIWNGITVLAASYKEPDGSNLLVTALNYAHEPLPVQLRVPGTFSTISYESPDDAPTLLPFTHRAGHTEFVLPALRLGARVFLAR